MHASNGPILQVLRRFFSFLDFGNILIATPGGKIGRGTRVRGKVHRRATCRCTSGVGASMCACAFTHDRYLVFFFASGGKADHIQRLAIGGHFFNTLHLHTLQRWTPRACIFLVNNQRHVLGKKYKHAIQDTRHKFVTQKSKLCYRSDQGRASHALTLAIHYRRAFE